MLLSGVKPFLQDIFRRKVFQSVLLVSFLLPLMVNIIRHHGAHWRTPAISLTLTGIPN